MKKKAIFSVLSAAVLAFSANAPASAATLTTTFTQAGSIYGVTTECTNFSGYVTAHAQVGDSGSNTHRSLRGYRASTVTATRYCAAGSSIRQSGWYSY